ncbi:MAG TPA: HD domain-containing protein [Bacteroidales bacterium]|nr:HD domain-containing protein [Bacteroidales bacterium]
MKIANTQPIEEAVKQRLENEGSGHDWHHILRVKNLSAHIARAEGENLIAAELLALLHESTDHKLVDDPAAGLKEASELLDKAGVDADLKYRLLQDIPAISYKGADVKDADLSETGKIVQDADRLDALGAIGIARTFAYGGSKGRSIYNPDCPPEKHGSFESYKKSSGPAINHFYEKLLLLKDRMHTKTAREIARKRHGFMIHFLDEFYREWNFPEQMH